MGGGRTERQEDGEHRSAPVTPGQQRSRENGPSPGAMAAEQVRRDHADEGSIPPPSSTFYAIYQGFRGERGGTLPRPSRQVRKPRSDEKPGGSWMNEPLRRWARESVLRMRTEFGRMTTRKEPVVSRLSPHRRGCHRHQGARKRRWRYFAERNGGRSHLRQYHRCV